MRKKRAARRTRIVRAMEDSKDKGAVVLMNGGLTAPLMGGKRDASSGMPSMESASADWRILLRIKIGMGIIA